MKEVLNILFNDFTNDNRVLKESRSLQKNGYKVHLLATHFEKELPQEEEIEGFKVTRFNVGRLKILPLNLILFWLKGLFAYKREDIIHANDLYALPPAVFIKKFINRKVKIVYDCHEHETEAQIYAGKPMLKMFARISERMMINSADKIITVSESIAKDYIKMYEVEEPSLVMNCPYYEEFKGKDLFREELDIDKEKILFLYQGKYQKGRGLNNLIRIFEELEKENKKLVLVLLVFGENIEELRERIKGIDNIYWHDKVSPDIYMNYVASADWGVHFMENTCKNHDYAMPNKLFDYFMGGLPVIVSDLKEMSNFVRKHSVGYVVNLEEAGSAIEILKSISKEEKEKFINSVRKVAKEYTWEQQEKVLLKIYNSL